MILLDRNVGRRLVVVRPVAGAALDLIVVSDGVIPAFLHWLDGRSYLCVGEGCPACDVQAARRVWYLGVQAYRPLLGERSATALLCLSEESWMALSAQVTGSGDPVASLLGGHIRVLSRGGRKPMGVSYQGMVSVAEPFPVAAVGAALGVLYGMPFRRANEACEEFVARCKEMLRAKLTKLVS